MTPPSLLTTSLLAYLIIMPVVQAQDAKPVTGSTDDKFAGGKLAEVYKPEFMAVPFGKLFGTSGPDYSPTFGTVAWKSPGATLYEVIYRSLPVGEGGIKENVIIPVLSEPFNRILEERSANKELVDAAREGLTSRANRYLKRLEENDSLILKQDYAQKLGGNRMLAFSGEDGSAVLLRLRKDFQFLNENSEEADFIWTDDRIKNESGTRYNAALMMDIYSDALYNEARFNPFGWINNPFRVALRLGAQVNYNDSSANPVDLQKYYALATFTANPDMDARFFSIAGAEITSPQFIQLGLVYTRNSVDDSDDIAPIIGWQPKFRANEGQGKSHLNAFGEKVLDNPATARFKGFGLNNRMLYREGGFAKFWTGGKYTVQGLFSGDRAGEESNKPSKWYTELNPDIQLVGPNGADVNLKGKPAEVLKALKDYKESTLRWKVEGKIGYDEGRYELSGGAYGVHPLGNLSDSHLYYTVRFDWRPVTEHSLYSWSDDAGNPIEKTSAWSGLKAFVEYKHGEMEPNFVKEDIITAGVGLKF